jgi:hypothetical protein
MNCALWVQSRGIFADSGRVKFNKNDWERRPTNGQPRLEAARGTPDSRCRSFADGLTSSDQELSRFAVTHPIRIGCHCQ